MNLEHTRHCSPINFIVHILVCVTGFSLLKSINKHLNFDSQLTFLILYSHFKISRSPTLEYYPTIKVHIIPP